jgi:hypothetical protein
VEAPADGGEGEERRNVSHTHTHAQKHTHTHAQKHTHTYAQKDTQEQHTHTHTC